MKREYSVDVRSGSMGRSSSSSVSHSRRRFPYATRCVVGHAHTHFRGAAALANVSAGAAFALRSNL